LSGSSPRDKRYYDVQKNWRKVKRHVDHPDLQAVLVEDMDRYTRGVWGKRFHPGMSPADLDPGNWIFDVKKGGGPLPAFWRYVCYRACYWLVNFNLLLAMRIEPARAWRIIESDRHATVWDGGGHPVRHELSRLRRPPGRLLRGRPRLRASAGTAAGDRYPEL
jgi:hypothetical protein